MNKIITSGKYGSLTGLVKDHSNLIFLDYENYKVIKCKADIRSDTSIRFYDFVAYTYKDKYNKKSSEEGPFLDPNNSWFIYNFKSNLKRITQKNGLENLKGFLYKKGYKFDSIFDCIKELAPEIHRILLGKVTDDIFIEIDDVYYLKDEKEVMIDSLKKENAKLRNKVNELKHRLDRTIADLKNFKDYL